jgi:hypothetical protein
MNRFEYQQFGAKMLAKRGSDLPHTKLTPDQVAAIRINRHGKTAKTLAADYGVHHRTIEKIRYRETHAL